MRRAVLADWLIVFDVEAVETAPVRILFRLADIDEYVRAAPGGKREVDV